jgi:V/A-type H+-transporting ATPase subunit I
MIVEMAHVLILGPRGILPEVLGRLQAEGVLQIRSLPERLRRERVRRIPVEEAQPGVERRLEEAARRLRELLLLLPAPGEAARLEQLPDVSAAEFLARIELLESEVRALTSRRLTLAEERDLLARYEKLVTALLPLRSQLSGIDHLQTLGILVRRDRPDVLALLEEEVDRMSRGAYTMLARDLDREQMAVLLAVPRETARDVSRLLFERGISEIRLPEQYADQPLIDTLPLLLRRSREIAIDIDGIEAAIARLAHKWYGALSGALRAAQGGLARLRAMSSCGETEHAFVISGWVPAENSRQLARTLEAAFHGRVTLVDTPIQEAEYDEVPVLLQNPGFIRPFELLLAFLPLPRYASIDPTPFLAGFFPLFFGLMLGDVGFGAVALALALAARAGRWGKEIGQQIAAIAVPCSVSAIVFGFLFGELFGELGRLLGLRPLLWSRKEAPLPMLAVALGLGALHIVIGISLALWTALHRGRRREALAKTATLGLIAAAIVGFLAWADQLAPAFGTAALIALGVLLALSLALEGIPALLEVVMSFGNVLSYARLMALGLASVMLTDVANRMVEVFRPPALGVMVAVLLHGVAFALGLVSPAIQALRLHYVEFFDKFYEGGGKPYQPFTLTA